MKPRSEARLVTAYLELPPDGSYQAMRIYIKSADGKELTYQAVLDAVSDVLIEDACFSADERDKMDLSSSWDS